MYKKLITYIICIALKSHANIDLENDKIKLCLTLLRLVKCKEKIYEIDDENEHLSSLKIKHLDSLLTIILLHASIVCFNECVYMMDP